MRMDLEGISSIDSANFSAARFGSLEEFFGHQDSPIELLDPFAETIHIGFARFEAAFFIL